MSVARIKDIFFRALELPESERTDFIARECEGEEELVEQVTELVRHHARADEFLASPSRPSREPAIEAMPESIGGRRVVRPLGRGGFGVVYLAEQTEPVRMKVAIKVVRPGMASGEVLARFAAEQRALERMKHPNIASVLDAGTTPEGRPYFVLEYVEGETITRWAHEHGASLEERCNLLIDVCKAVQHAHEKGVMHRDIKPSNVLVTTIDGRPIPKVIDFGLAKAIRGTLSDSSALTMVSQIVGTPQYMSPEQVSMGKIDVDTRTDVYSIGALAYELFVGAPAFSIDQVRGASPIELERLIRLELPPRPSSRVIQEEGRVDAAVRRARKLRGDLDWIVMKAMEKEPARRYHSAEAIAADLTRHLRSEPVEAGPPSRLYRLRKLIGRHRVEFGAAMVVMLALAITAVVSLDAAARARIEEKKAAQAAREALAEQEKTARELEKFEAVAAFSEEMLVGIDPRFARGADSALMRRMLDQAATRLENEAPTAVEVEVHLRRIVGLAYHAIAENGEASRQLRRAWELARDRLPPSDDRRQEAAMAWAQILAGSGQVAEALALFQDIADTREEHRGVDDPKTLEARSNLAVTLGMLGRHSEAHDLHDDVVRRRERVLGAEHDDTMASWNNLASEKDALGLQTESAKIFEKVLAHQLRTLGRTHPRTLATMNNVALAYEKAGMIAEATSMLAQVLEIKRTILPEGHPSIVIGLNNLASIHGERGEPETAIRLLDEAIALAEQPGVPLTQNAAILYNNKGANLARARRHEEALTAFRIAGEGFDRIFGRGHVNALKAWLGAADELIELGRAEEARAVIERLAEALSHSGPEAAPVGPLLSQARGRALLRLGRADEARAAFEEGLRVIRSVQADQPEKVQTYVEAVAKSLEAAGLASEAAVWRAR